MFEIIWGGAANPKDRELMATWCANHIWPGLEKSFGSCTTMGVIRKGRMIAVVVFHNWQPECGVIEMSAASTDKRWLTRRVLHAMFSYCFDTTGVQMVVLRTAPGDTVMRRIMKSYGFKSYCIARLRGRNEDELINTLTDDDWKSNRFERQRNGKSKSTATA